MCVSPPGVQIRMAAAARLGGLRAVLAALFQHAERPGYLWMVVSFLG